MKQTIFRKTKIKTLRSWLALKLVRLAYWIEPGNDEGKAFLLDLMMEDELQKMKYGKSFIEVKINKEKLI